MRHRSIIALFAVALLTGFAAQAARAADTYKIDPVHAFVTYRIKHFNIGYSYGRFNDPTGEVVLDSSDPSKSTFNIEVKTDNLDTHNDKRDQHLKGPDFFDVKQFPTITFKSTSVKADGDKFAVTGDLTLHGVTKSITISLDKTGEGDTKMAGVRTGWETTLDIKRSDYGMNGMQGGIGDDVKLMISFEGVKQ